MLFNPQMDLSDLDLETLAPYIPMDGEDFQLNPIIPEPEALESLPVGGSLAQSQQSFSNMASLFQPLSSPPQAQSPYQQRPAAPWTPKDKRGTAPRGAVDARAGSCMMTHVQNPPYQAPASTPLSSMGGRQNLQWPPDPLLTYQHSASGARKGFVVEAAEERLSCQQNLQHGLQRQRSDRWN